MRAKRRRVWTKMRRRRMKRRLRTKRRMRTTRRRPKRRMED